MHCHFLFTCLMYKRLYYQKKWNKYHLTPNILDWGLRMDNWVQCAVLLMSTNLQEPAAVEEGNLGKGSNSGFVVL